MTDPVPVRPAPDNRSTYSRRGVFFTWRLVVFLAVVFVVTSFATGFVRAWWHDTHGHWAPQRNTPEYDCHTFPTWDSRNYAAFTAERDGQTIACWQVGPRWVNS